MEMIDGLSLDEYAAKHKCSQKEILELMRLVCNGVQHAHVRGVIHCDIKPANILVSEDGQPHVLDFGLARLTTTRPDGLTENGSAPGTPSWMSPEQAGGMLDKIDTRTDVYSLGKILYQLLTGQPPHRTDGPIGDVLHRIATEEVRPPRAACPKLSGELCAILLKALHREPEGRYSSAGELARDIERFQAGQVVAAMPASALYPIRKWLRRHRWPVSIGVAALVAAICWAGSSYIKLRRELQTAELVNSFTESVLRAIDSGNSDGRDVTSELMSRARLVTTRFTNNPQAQADVSERLGNVLYSLGQLEPAQEQFQQSATLRQRAFGAADARTLLAKERLAQVCRERGKFDLAERFCQEIIQSNQEKFGESHRQSLRAAVALGQVLEDRAILSSDPQAMLNAENLLQKTITKCEASLGVDDVDTFWAKAALVPVLRFQKGEKLSKADELSQKVLEARQLKLGPLHRQTLESIHDRACVMAEMGRAKEAEEMLRDALVFTTRVPGFASAFAPASDRHPDLLIWSNDLAYTLVLQGKFKEAEKIYMNILPASSRSRGPEHPFNVIIRKNLAAALVGQGKWAEATKEFQQAANLHARLWGTEHPETLSLYDYQAWALTAQNEWAKAEKIYARNLEARLRKLPPEDKSLEAARKRLEKARAHLPAEVPTSKPAAPASR
jgi:tetratricopeptide (TPR) repeat protein